MIGLTIETYDGSMRRELLKRRDDIDNLSGELYQELLTYEFPLLRREDGRKLTDRMWLDMYLDQEGAIMVAIFNGKVVGFLAVRADLYVDTYIITELFVLKKHRDKGIGKTLLATLNEYMKKVVKGRHLTVTVHSRNTRAVRFYKRDQRFTEFAETLTKRI